MFKKIKKHFNKILIACLTLISSIALFSSINNTYAYESTQFSYTVNNIKDSNGNDITYTTIGNYNGLLIENGSFSYNYYTFDSIYSPPKSSYALVNYLIIDSNNNIDNNFSPSSCTLILSPSNNSNQRYINIYKTYSNSNIYTSINSGNSNNNVFYNRFYLSGMDTGYKLLIINIDYVDTSEIGLQQYYDTYYSQIEQNYNDLLDDYNDLEDDYDELVDSYDTLWNNYRTLQDNYDSLQENYNSINDIYKYGSFAFIDEIYIDGYYYPDNNEGDPVYTTLNVIQDKQTALENIKDDHYNIYELNTTYPGINATIQFNFNNLYLGYLQLKLKSPTYGGFIEYYLYNENNQMSYYRESIGGDITIDIEHIKTFNSNITTNYKLASFRIDSLYNGDMYNYQSIAINTYYASVYNTAFTNGVNEGKEQLQPEINYLNNEIETQQQQITSQELTIRTITAQYEELQDRYNNITSGNNDLYSMIIAVADTPLRIFTQIFNFNILGINISGFILSLISLLVIIWLIKKII